MLKTKNFYIRFDLGRDPVHPWRPPVGDDITTNDLNVEGLFGKSSELPDPHEGGKVVRKKIAKKSRFGSRPTDDVPLGRTPG